MDALEILRQMVASNLEQQKGMLFALNFSLQKYSVEPEKETLKSIINAINEKVRKDSALFDAPEFPEFFVWLKARKEDPKDLAWAFYYALEETINPSEGAAAKQQGIVGYVEGLRWVLSRAMQQEEQEKKKRIQEEREAAERQLQEAQKRIQEEREAAERQKVASAGCYCNNSNDTRTYALNPAMVIGWSKYTRAV